MLESWDNVPIIFVTFALCPHCNRKGHINSGVRPNGDGSKTRQCVCKHCSRRFCVVAEPSTEIILPENGKSPKSTP